ncbi:hypothetical protein SARC_05731 [Sphaeroforma arctica JP610]|uniref:Uncharacterized protein n=1 Tax=Sphaeroforma arctica JP610 TaxID=667725 RepID=A0A0L0FYQ7_9EUKA|nr:hypothetical protein SARC_05731 [Sphaeroforma arctica JP610]KNC81982.1 hypothetical protein SARC_05731 [Sphaeroforma arctica JP610]|eukprot:XP_014155884.1 hypothetical protein SARC_05731 [Sphaeroforma arctica JP610]
MPIPENLVVYNTITRKFLNWFRPNYDFDQHTNLKANNDNLREILLAIQSDDLCRYFNELAYGIQIPGPDDRPTLKRANGILFDKKAISWYMRRNNEWDLVDEKGNPTISLALNNMIKQVAPWELRGEGLTVHLIERLDDRADPSTLILECMFTANGQTSRDDQLKTDYSRSALTSIVAPDEFEARGSVPDIAIIGL